MILALYAPIPRRPFPAHLLYPLLGVLVSIASPVGYIVMHFVLRESPITFRAIAEEVAAQPLLYGYMAGTTFLVLVTAGWVIGRKEDTLKKISATDSLTGLWNRRHARARLGQEIARATRYGRPVSLLLIDLDRLKSINDEGGHAAGDEALQRLGACLQAECRASDVAARYGGDEFVVIAPETSGERAAEQAARICAAVREERALPRLSVSIGVADLERAGSVDVDALYEAADAALYEAKRAGRDRSVLAPKLPSKA